MGPRRLILEAARAAGFDLAGVCDPETAEAMPHYERWLADGKAAGMEYLARHTDAKRDPDFVLAGVRSVVALGAFYAGPHSRADGVARYAAGRDYHRALRRAAEPVAAAVREAHPEARTRVCVDSAPTLDRYWAHRAGLGWFGKNTMLIDSRRGSWFLVALVLTDAWIERDAPAIGGCGTCRRCVEACPTGAIVHDGARWTVDARLCVAYHTIESRAETIPPTHGWTFGCDVCQEVCPFNETRETQPARNPEPRIEALLPDRRFPDLAALRVLSDAEWDAMTRGSATRRATPAMWRRNARASQKDAASGDSDDESADR